ncbi:MAG: tryptophan-rich sensory protein, partial [Clostridia bacterium]|nr:tryptophan-rich sensory protein [Clostridia bacterium]
MEKKNDFWPYAAFILLSLLVGGLATLVSVDGMRAFQDLPQSPLTPPPVVFSIVWSILYVLMGVSAALIYGVEPRGLKDQHLLYAGTLLLNFLWPVLFFALELRLAALVVLLVMIALAIGTVVRYRPLSRPAAWLQLP